jgi:hypothetical protein
MWKLITLRTPRSSSCPKGRLRVRLWTTWFVRGSKNRAGYQYQPRGRGEVVGSITFLEVQENCRLVPFRLRLRLHIKRYRFQCLTWRRRDNSPCFLKLYKVYIDILISKGPFNWLGKYFYSPNVRNSV